MKEQTDVLVIGGGFGGVGATQKLAQSGMDVTLVDQKDYFEVTFATLRDVTSPNRLNYTPRKHYQDFIKGTFIQAGVESMNDKEAKLTNGKVIQFKQAIISSGSRYPTLPLAKSLSSFELTERDQEMHKEHGALAAASSVLIIGGGTVGVEFAGEIASAFPDKNITLAHSANSLLNDQKPKAQRKALEQLADKGIQVKFNRRFEKNEDVYHCSISNETIQADITYECTGMIPNTEFLEPELPNTLDSKGFIKVDTNMRVEGYQNLYALGDCATLDTHKHGYIASVQGAMLADALLKSAKGKKVKPYKTPPFAVITPTGTNSGVAQMPFGVTTAKFFVNLKQKDMGISNMYKMFKTTPNNGARP